MYCIDIDRAAASAKDPNLSFGELESCAQPPCADVAALNVVSGLRRGCGCEILLRKGAKMSGDDDDAGSSCSTNICGLTKIAAQCPRKARQMTYLGWTPIYRLQVFR